MAIPDWQSLNLPLLRLLGERGEHRFDEAVEALAEELELTDKDRGQLMPSGRKRTFDERLKTSRWALKKAGLVEQLYGGYLRITGAGLDLLGQNPKRIDKPFLERLKSSPERSQEEQSPRQALEKAVASFERHWRQKLQALDDEVMSLRDQNASLREELSREATITDEIGDPILRDRVSRLGSPPLDTLIREAGVVLEDRLRSLAGEDARGLVGVKLVDKLLKPPAARVVFSNHDGEQEGVQQLYRGAMQFIRNPPMHKLIVYPESTARLLIRLVDSLLVLLSEAEPPGTVSVAAVRRMLTRIRVPKGQQDLYKVLYNAGESGVTSSDLSKALGRTPQQLAGVLGALGRRVNGTEGLHDKGGIGAIMDISPVPGGEWKYTMLPVLRKALEEEGLV